jgi:hypothetical protein
MAADTGHRSRGGALCEHGRLVPDVIEREVRASWLGWLPRDPPLDHPVMAGVAARRRGPQWLSRLRGPGVTGAAGRKQLAMLDVVETGGLLRRGKPRDE